MADEAARLRRLIPEDADIAEFASLTAKAEQMWISAWQVDSETLRTEIQGWFSDRRPPLSASTAPHSLASRRST